MSVAGAVMPLPVQPKNVQPVRVGAATAPTVEPCCTKRAGMAVEVAPFMSKVTEETTGELTGALPVTPVSPRACTENE